MPRANKQSVQQPPPSLSNSRIPDCNDEITVRFFTVVLGCSVQYCTINKLDYNRSTLVWDDFVLNDSSLHTYVKLQVVDDQNKLDDARYTKEDLWTELCEINDTHFTSPVTLSALPQWSTATKIHIKFALETLRTNDETEIIFLRFHVQSNLTSFTYFLLQGFSSNVFVKDSNWLYSKRNGCFHVCRVV